jgi:hypothetical protein
MNLEPMQKAIGNIGNEMDVGTAVIDGVFASEVHLSINVGLTEIATGNRTPQQVAVNVQRAFENLYK